MFALLMEPLQLWNSGIASWYNRIELWLQISSQAISVCSGETTGSQLRNPEVPRNLGWKTLA